MTVATMSARAIANLGWDEISLSNPIYVGIHFTPRARLFPNVSRARGLAKGSLLSS
jgi:hypothetical protein